MRIAIIGGLGFIGRELTSYLAALGHKIIVLDQVRYALTADDPFEYVPIDLFEECASIDADALVMLAAQRPYAAFSFDDYENNVRMAKRSFDLAYQSGIRNVVFASSKAVYSDQEHMPWKEESNTAPSSLYGASKSAAEQLALLMNSTQGMYIKCLRFAQVIGKGERKGYLINTLIDNALAGKMQVVYGDGSQRRQYIYVRDVCRAVLSALCSDGAQGIYNIGMPGGISNLELAEAINEVFGNKDNLICDYSKPMSTYCDEMDVTKASREIGFRAKYCLHSLLEDLKGNGGV